MSGLPRSAAFLASMLALTTVHSHATTQTPPTFPAGVEVVRIDLVAVQGLKGGLIRNPFRDAMTDYDAMRFSEYAGRDAPPARGPGATFSVPPALMAEERYELAKRRVRQSLGGLADSIESLAGFR